MGHRIAITIILFFSLLANAVLLDGVKVTNTGANPVPVTVSGTPTVNVGTPAVTQSGSWSVGLLTGSNVIGSISNSSFGISGTLPAFAATPTFNIGTIAGIATESTLSTLNSKIPASPATDRTTAVAPFSLRLSDGTAFYKATTPSDTQPISAASLPLPSGAATDSSLSTINTSINTLLKPASTLSAVTTLGSITNSVTIKADTPANQTNALKVDGSAVTQPVSLASVPTHPVTQSGTWNVGLNAGANAIGSITNTSFGISGTLPSFASTPTFNVGTTNGIALDATLTGGTQKAIARGGAKGATTAADVTSTNVDANTQALDVSVKGTPTVSVTSSALPSGAATETTLSALNTKIPASPAQDRTTAAAPHATRLTDGTAFYKATTPADTQPISAASLPLPTGASTSALQTTGNTSLGNIDTKLIDGTQKSIARGGAKGTTTAADVTSTNVDANTQALDVSVKGTAAISAASLPLPSGASTSALQTTGNTSLSNIDGKLPTTLGQKTMANSFAMTIASDQSAIPITGSITATNPSVSGTGSAVPAQATYIAANNGGNLVGVTNTSSGATKKPLDVAIYDGSGNQITSFGGGTQYTNASAQATPTGTVSLGYDGSNVRALATDTTGKLNINNISGSVSLPTGAATETTLSSLNGKVTAVNTGAVTISTALPVGTNSIGQVTANAGTNLNTSALNLETTQSAINTKIPSGLTVSSSRLLVDHSGLTQPSSLVNANASGNITTQNLNPAGTATAGSAVELTLSTGYSIALVQVTGTYTGALSLQYTVNNTDWVTHATGNDPAFFNLNTGLAAFTIGSGTTGIFKIPVAGATKVRITGLAAMTGTAAITINATVGNWISQANQTVNQNLVGGATITVNNGVAGSGTQRVVIASDQTAYNVLNTEVRPATATTSNVASSATNVTCLASNSARRKAMFFNDSTQVAFLKLGATASSTSFTVKILAGGYYEIPTPVYTGIVDCIWAAANGSMRVTEY
ncbi:beta strand repeat-containing protein [Immundisolibacter sp.]